MDILKWIGVLKHFHKVWGLESDTFKTNPYSMGQSPDTAYTIFPTKQLNSTYVNANTCQKSCPSCCFFISYQNVYTELHVQNGWSAPLTLHYQMWARICVKIADLFLFVTRENS